MKLGRTKRQRADREVPRSRQLVAALIAGVIIAVATYAAFVKQLPFESQFQIKADFASANQLLPGSLVRIAGLNIGKVTAIGPGPHESSIVTMEIDDHSVPIHSDATFSVIPRLILEGNDYVNVAPGTPSAPLLRNGATVGESQTSDPVQLDQVLDVLDQPTRYALKDTIANLAAGLGSAGGPQTESGAAGLSEAARQLDGALASVTQVATALQGTQSGDLTRAIHSTGDMTAQFAQNPSALANLVTNYNRVVGVLAANSQALSSSIYQLNHLFRVAPPALTSLDRALPQVTTLANALRPALQVAPTPLAHASDFVSQLGALVSSRELPNLLTDLAPVTTNLPPLERQLEALFPYVNSVMGCVNTHIVPTLDHVLPDPAGSTGDPIWLDYLHGLANFAGAAADFDGNGSTLRLGVTEGNQALQGFLPGLGTLSGVGPAAEGVDPIWLGYGVNPQFRPDLPCKDQPLPASLAARAGAASTSLHATPLKPLSTAERSILQGLLGTPAQRRALLAQLLAGLTPSSSTTARARQVAASLQASAPTQPTKPQGQQPAKPRGQQRAGASSSAAPASPAPTPQQPVSALVQKLLGIVNPGTSR